LAASDLVVVWAGANDYLGDLPPAGDLTPIVTGTVENLSAAITRLAAAGGRRFLVPNLPDLGATPLISAGGPAAVQQYSAATTLHNQQLAATLQTLRQSLGVEITLLDVGSIFQDARLNPAAYGLTNTTTSCITGTAASPLTPSNPTGACPTPESEAATLFWDGVHPTTAAHAVLADISAATMDSERTAGAAVGVQTGFAHLVAGFQGQAISARLSALRSGISGLVGMGIAPLDPQSPQADAPQYASAVAQVGDDLLTAPTGGGTRLAGDPDKPLAMFVYGGYGTGDRDAVPGRAAFDYRTWLLSAGLDYRITDWAVVGASIGYSRSDLDLDRNAGDLESDSVVFSLYGGVEAGPWYGEAAASYSLDDYSDISRRTGSAIFPTAQAETEGSTLALSLGTGYRFRAGPATFGPIAGIRYERVGIDGYTETGARLLNLTVEDQTSEVVTGSIGAQGSVGLQLGNLKLTPTVSVALEQTLGDGDESVSTHLGTGPSVVNTVDGGDESVVVVGAGVGFDVGGSVTGAIGYQGALFRNDGSDHAVVGRLRLHF
jgi:outer membrane lipase/esterase